MNKQPERSIEEIVEEKLKELRQMFIDQEAFLGIQDTTKIVICIKQLSDLIQAERQKREELVEAIEKEVGGFIAGAYALKFDDNSREAKFWDVWKDGYEQCRKDALNAIKYESRRQD